MALSRNDIVAGLRALGLQLGDRVLMHSSLAALGDVDGGPDTVIDALLDVVGREGLVVVPTFGCKPPFDRKTSATPLGAIADQLWRRPNAFRSLHPTHSVAAIGRGAEELLRGHEKAPTAYGEGTPYHALAINGGKILLLGVDQDRNTLAVVASDISDDPEELLRALKGEGISAVEVTKDTYQAYGHALTADGIEIVAVQAEPNDHDSVHLAQTLNVPVIMPVSARALGLAMSSEARVLITNAGAPSSFYEKLYASFPDLPGLALNPGRFAAAGEKPFLEVFYRGKLRRKMEHFYIDDATFSGEYALPGQGNGEVKEIISMLRCRSYNGVMTLRSPLGGVDNFRRSAAAFWNLLDNM